MPTGYTTGPATHHSRLRRRSSEHGRQATALTDPQDAAGKHNCGSDRTPHGDAGGAQLRRSLDHQVVPVVGGAVVRGGVVGGAGVGAGRIRMVAGVVSDRCVVGAVVHDDGWRVVDNDGRVKGVVTRGAAQVGAAQQGAGVPGGGQHKRSEIGDIP
jgi:hypothetical protein